MLETHQACTILDRGAETVLVSLLLAVAAGPSSAQTNDEINAGLQFSFAPPGARSLAMGYAFAGRADDATAAFANPAGLLWLRRHEVSAELRSSSFVTRYPDLGSATGQPTFCMPPRFPTRDPPATCLDTLEGLRFADFESRTSGLAFASYVHAFKPSKRRVEDRARGWRLGLFRHELANFRAEIDRSQGAFIGGEGTARGLRSRLAGVSASLDLQIQSFGVVAARAVTPKLWLGVALSVHEFSLRSETRRYRSIVADGNRANVALPGPLDFSDANESDRHLQAGSDLGQSLTVGVLWHGSLRGRPYRWSIGGVYRQAPSFALDYSFRWQDRAYAEAAALDNPDFADPGIERALSGRTEFEVPDVISLGFAIRATDRLRLSFQYDRIGYSNLEPEANILLNVLNEDKDRCGEFDPAGRPQEDVPCVVDESRLGKFHIDDGNELHFGAEYELGRNVIYSLRLGSWRDPDHQMAYRFDHDDVGDGEEVDIDRLQAPVDRFAPRFAAGDDEWHWTVGLGVLPVGRAFEFNVGYDHSDRGEIVSLSFVRFFD